MSKHESDKKSQGMHSNLHHADRRPLKTDEFMKGVNILEEIFPGTIRDVVGAAHIEARNEYAERYGKDPHELDPQESRKYDIKQKSIKSNGICEHPKEYKQR